jgi:hypothetical protein
MASKVGTGTADGTVGTAVRAQRTTNVLRKPRVLLCQCGLAMTVLGVITVALLALEATTSHSMDQRLHDLVVALAQERARAMGAAVGQGFTGVSGSRFGRRDFDHFVCLDAMECPLGEAAGF